MGIEESLESIAMSLEKLANPMQVTVAPETNTGAAPDLLPASTKKGKASKEKPAPATPAPAVEKPEVAKEDITAVLQSFLKKFPGPDGAEKARAFFTKVGAKNITTLDPSKYKEVFLGLQDAMK